jgi:hypothetical protein
LFERMVMIRMLCTTWYPDGPVSLLISTSTNIVHSIWLAGMTSGVHAPNISI